MTKSRKVWLVLMVLSLTWLTVLMFPKTSVLLLISAYCIISYIVISITMSHNKHEEVVCPLCMGERVLRGIDAEWAVRETADDEVPCYLCNGKGVVKK